MMVSRIHQQEVGEFWVIFSSYIFLLLYNVLQMGKCKGSFLLEKHMMISILYLGRICPLKYKKEES